MSKPSMWSMQGRIGRGGFWIGMILCLLLDLLAQFLTGLTTPRQNMGPIIILIYSPISVAISWIGLAATVKRWHDLNHSGWMILLNFTIIAIPFTFIYTGFFKGTDGPNRFGADSVNE